MIDHDEIIWRAWGLYYSEETQELAGYTQYDALFDIVCAMGVVGDISDAEYEFLMREMECF